MVHREAESLRSQHAGALSATEAASLRATLSEAEGVALELRKQLAARDSAVIAADATHAMRDAERKDLLAQISRAREEETRLRRRLVKVERAAVESGTQGVLAEKETEAERLRRALERTQATTSALEGAVRRATVRCRYLLHL
jgi:hypothetical protein